MKGSPFFYFVYGGRRPAESGDRYAEPGETRVLRVDLVAGDLRAVR